MSGRSATRRPRAVVLLLSTCLLGAACQSPVRVERVGARAVYSDLTRNVLSSGELSEATELVLDQTGLRRLHRKRPEEVLELLHQVAVALPASNQLPAALAELSFALGERRGDRSRFLASAVYAYRFLFHPNQALRPRRADPRVRLAMDLYNRGLAEAFRDRDGRHLRILEGVYPLPFGEVDLRIDDSGRSWGAYRLTDLESAAELRVHGLLSRHRQRGIGVATIATPRAMGEAVDDAGLSRFAPRGTKVPLTLLVRLDVGDDALAVGWIQGRAEFHQYARSPEVELEGAHLPVEAEPSSALAAGLDESAFWGFHIAGFRQGDLKLFDERILMMSPYREDRIPLVLVHGTLSSPATWAQLLNELAFLPTLRERYQVWLFIYNSGVPVVSSAASLRDALTELVEKLDPRGESENLRRMVLVGHSQGGLLVRMNVVSSGNRLWELISDRPFEEVSLRDRNRELLSRSLFFEPLPFVERAVFMATPHRGSFVADRWLGRLGQALSRAPAELIDLAGDLVAGDPVLMRRVERSSPSSVRDMRTDSAFLATLGELPFSERVGLHSIIGVRQDGPVEEGDDGVVAYTSAHLEQADSERVVRSGHAVHRDPVAIIETARILYRHLGLEPEGLGEAADLVEELRRSR